MITKSWGSSSWWLQELMLLRTWWTRIQTILLWTLGYTGKMTKVLTSKQNSDGSVHPVLQVPCSWHPLQYQSRDVMRAQNANRLPHLHPSCIQLNHSFPKHSHGASHPVEHFRLPRSVSVSWVLRYSVEAGYQCGGGAPSISDSSCTHLVLPTVGTAVQQRLTHCYWLAEGDLHCPGCSDIVLYSASPSGTWNTIGNNGCSGSSKWTFNTINHRIYHHAWFWVRFIHLLPQKLLP